VWGEEMKRGGAPPAGSEWICGQTDRRGALSAGGREPAGAPVGAPHTAAVETSVWLQVRSRAGRRLTASRPHVIQDLHQPHLRRRAQAPLRLRGRCRRIRGCAEAAVQRGRPDAPLAREGALGDDLLLLDLCDLELGGDELLGFFGGLVWWLLNWLVVR
jgi:hypothetical protein